MNDELSVIIDHLMWGIEDPQGKTMHPTAAKLHIWAGAQGLTLLTHGDIPDHHEISSDTSVSVRCRAGHLFVWRAADLWACKCPICGRLETLRGSDQATRYVDTWPGAVTDGLCGGHGIVFECGRGHHYVDNVMRPECSVCRLLVMVNGQFDTHISVMPGCTYVNATTQLRFRCSKQHNKKKITESCRREFYMSSQRVRAIVASDPTRKLSCHLQKYRAERQIIIALRTFEIAYKARMDCPTAQHGIVVTGYSESCGVAFVHETDAAAVKSLSRTEVWARLESVLLLYIKRSATVARILEQICEVTDIDINEIQRELASIPWRSQQLLPADELI
jgi:hypothetical protein